MDNVPLMQHWWGVAHLACAMQGSLRLFRQPGPGPGSGSGQGPGSGFGSRGFGVVVVVINMKGFGDAFVVSFIPVGIKQDDRRKRTVFFC